MKLDINWKKNGLNFILLYFIHGFSWLISSRLETSWFMIDYLKCSYFSLETNIKLKKQIFGGEIVISDFVKADLITSKWGARPKFVAFLEKTYLYHVNEFMQRKLIGQGFFSFEPNAVHQEALLNPQYKSWWVRWREEELVKTCFHRWRKRSIRRITCYGAVL